MPTCWELSVLWIDLLHGYQNIIGGWLLAKLDKWHRELQWKSGSPKLDKGHINSTQCGVIKLKEPESLLPRDVVVLAIPRKARRSPSCMPVLSAWNWGPKSAKESSTMLATTSSTSYGSATNINESTKTHYQLVNMRSLPCSRHLLVALCPYRPGHDLAKMKMWTWEEREGWKTTKHSLSTSTKKCDCFTMMAEGHSKYLS